MSACHYRSKHWLNQKIFDDLESFLELETRIDAIPEEKDRGDVFEIFVEGFLATQSIMQSGKAWVVGKVPLDVREQLNLPNDSKGIDGVYRSRCGDLIPYQVKYRAKRPRLTYTEVAPFLGITEKARERVIFTNTNTIAVDAQKREGVRLIRGVDFDSLDKNDFAAINAWLNEKPAFIPRSNPRSYQRAALNDIGNALATHDRANVVMACGTGKTLVSLWATEDLKPKTVLVLLPSLSLLQQTLAEWSKQNGWDKQFRYLCFCSDQTVVQDVDQIEIDESEVEFRIDTDPAEVRRFLNQRLDGVKVVFSTYQSSPKVGEGVRGLAPIDVGIFDEAHKTTGHSGGAFSFALSDANISIRKRIFFTATPRHIDIRRKDKEGDVRVYSMDDEATYGVRAHTLSFSSAANQNIICKYKVIISLIDSDEVNEFALKNGITLVENDLLGTKWVANLVATQKAIASTRASKVISFHSRVSTAREFATDTTRGIAHYLPDFDVRHVNGKQNSADRKGIVEQFRRATKGVLTNARCLTEGIDVPAVDMVAFLDPKHSKVDIAQATGRAMRKSDGTERLSAM